jgi:very-short-patch-repair endonuclease
VPVDRVIRLEGATADLLRLALDPLPGGAPAVVGCRPTGLGLLAEQAEALLAGLEQAASGLFPQWLPGAAAIAGPQGAGVPAVRALAHQAAATSSHFGPFLADLAERSLRREPSGGNGFAPAVRAAGLARVIAASYSRPVAALLIELPEGLSASQERTLVSSTEWIAHYGGWGAWLTGAALKVVDRIDSYRIQLPAELADLADLEHLAAATDSAGRAGRFEAGAAGQAGQAGAPTETAPSNSVTAGAGFVRCPALIGLPRADSPAELKLESALSTQLWATGRVWNATYQPEPLAPTYRLDLWWATERCVVEIDGPEHHNAVHYAADRRRDVRLQLAGNAVLRFTNDQVLTDVRTVVSQIERYIRSRRMEVLEDQTNAR